MLTNHSTLIRPGTASGQPETVHGVEDLTMPVGTRDAVVPRAYIIPAQLGGIVAKLRAHDITVDTLAAPMRAEGEEFDTLLAALQPRA